jgi:hypothetical protein
MWGQEMSSHYADKHSQHGWDTWGAPCLILSALWASAHLARTTSEEPAHTIPGESLDWQSWGSKLGSQPRAPLPSPGPCLQTPEGADPLRMQDSLPFSPIRACCLSGPKGWQKSHPCTHITCISIWLYRLPQQALAVYIIFPKWNCK